MLSLRSQSRDMCLPFYGVLVSRADDPSNGFVFSSVICSRDCSSGTRCSSCASRIVRQEIKFSVESDVQRRAAKRTMIKNIANNPVLAATKICTLHKEVMLLLLIDTSLSSLVFVVHRGRPLGARVGGINNRPKGNGDVAIVLVVCQHERRR